MSAEPLRLKQLATAICLRLSNETYERIRNQPKEQVARDPGVVAFTAKLDAAAIKHELLSSSGLLIIRAPLDKVRAVLEPEHLTTSE